MGDSALTITAPAELDLRTGPPFAREVERRLDDGTPSAIVLDFGENTFVDSSGMGVLIGIREQCLERGVSLTLRALHTRVQRTLTTAGLLTVFTVEDGPAG